MEIIGDYISWIRENTKLKIIDGKDIISTPFMYSNRDLINITIIRNNGEIILSDDGETIFNVETLGVKLKKRLEVLKKFLVSYGLEITEDLEIIKKTNQDKIGKDMNDFIQGILSIDAFNINR